jgi:hypothetical protein
MVSKRGPDASRRDRGGIGSCINPRQARNVGAERAVLFAFDYDWKILRHDDAPALLLVLAQSGVFQNAPLKTFAHIPLGLERRPNAPVLRLRSGATVVPQRVGGRSRAAIACRRISADSGDAL